MIKIALHSVPRSGSSWVGSILDSSPHVAYRFQPLFSYEHKNQLDEKSSKTAIDEFFKNILHTSDEFVLQKLAIDKDFKPSFSKNDVTHIVYKEVRYHHIITNLLDKHGELKIVGIVRNPFAVIQSWSNAPKEFRKEKGWILKDEWQFAHRKNLNRVEEFNGYEKWKEVTFLFLALKERYPDRFLLVNYEDLLVNNEEAIENLFDFCELELTLQTKEFLKKSNQIHTDDAYSVYKSKKNDNEWKKSLPNFIVDTIKKDEGFIKINQIFKWI